MEHLVNTLCFHPEDAYASVDIGMYLHRLAEEAEQLVVAVGTEGLAVEIHIA